MSKEKKTFITQSGEVLTLKAVSQVSLTGIVSKFLVGKPLPPTQTVETTDGPREIANPNNKAYVDMLEALTGREQILMLAFIIQFGVRINLTEDQLEDVRDQQLDNKTLDPEIGEENNLLTYVYVTTVCNGEELKTLVETILSMSTPTARQVQNHVDAFRPDLSGQTAYGNQNAIVRDRVPDWQPSFNALQSGEVGRDELDNFLREGRPRVAG